MKWSARSDESVEGCLSNKSRNERTPSEFCDADELEVTEGEFKKASGEK